MKQSILIVFGSSVYKKDEITQKLKKSFDLKNVTTVYWTSEPPCSRKSAPPPCIKFDHIIEGHLNGMKSYQQLRRLLKVKPHLLAQPCILIDNHSVSIRSGGFDYTINTSEMKTRNFHGNELDVDRIVDKVVLYTKNWYVDKTAAI